MSRTNDRRQVLCYAISAKRYVIYFLGGPGQPVLCDWSEHGLGHLLNPADPEDSERKWIRTLWQGITIEDALGQSCAWPDWLSNPAVSRITVSSPSLLRHFDRLNDGESYAERVKPSNFVLSVPVATLGYPPNADPAHFHLYAPYTRDTKKWLRMRWIDGYTGRAFRVTTNGVTGDEGVARVKTVADVVSAYRGHPEPKSLGPDGALCDQQTRGLLQRRPVVALSLAFIGKESNKLEDRKAGRIHALGEVLTEYYDPRHDPFTTLVVPILRGYPAQKIARKAGLHPVTIKRIRSGASRPRMKHKVSLTSFAATKARIALRKWRVPEPDGDLACCAAYLNGARRRK